MTRTIELIVVLTLLIFAFFAGVNYSDSVKNHASWLFEAKEEEVELPDLSSESSNGAAVDETGEALDDNNANDSMQAAPQDAAAPMDNLEEEQPKK